MWKDLKRLWGLGDFGELMTIQRNPENSARFRRPQGNSGRLRGSQGKLGELRGTQRDSRGPWGTQGTQGDSGGLGGKLWIFVLSCWDSQRFVTFVGIVLDHAGQNDQDFMYKNMPDKSSAKCYVKHATENSTNTKWNTKRSSLLRSSLMWYRPS